MNVKLTMLHAYLRLKSNLREIGENLLISDYHINIKITSLIPSFCRKVDSQILTILRKRKEDCMLYEAPNYDRCELVKEQYNKAEENWFIKCIANFSFPLNTLYVQNITCRWRFGPVSRCNSLFFQAKTSLIMGKETSWSRISYSTVNDY